MGDSGFRADLDALRAQREPLAGLADRIERAHASLRSALAATERCWGSDDAGQSFARSHVDDAESTAQAIAGLPGKLSEVGRRFAATAEDYALADTPERFSRGEG